MNLSSLLNRLSRTVYPGPRWHGDRDTLWHIYSSRRRRYIIDILRDGTIERGPLAEAIAAEEFGPDHTDKERKAVYVSLVQTHLPLLEEHGIVEIEGYRVIPTPKHEAVRRGVDLMEGRVIA